MGDPNQDGRIPAHMPIQEGGGRTTQWTSGRGKKEPRPQGGPSLSVSGRELLPTLIITQKHLALLMGTSLFIFHGNLTVGRGRR